MKAIQLFFQMLCEYQRLKFDLKCNYERYRMECRIRHEQEMKKNIYQLMCAYSTIKRKKCKGLNCDKYPKIGYAGYCGKNCMPEEMQQLDKYRKGAVNSLRSQIQSKNSRVVHGHQKEIIGAKIVLKRFELEQWFDNIARIIARNPKCSECGAYISSAYYRHATAHIFPKAIFESVATHPMNYLILGAGCGCHDKTHRLDTFSDMTIFPEAVRRFRLFEKSITEKHKYLTTFLNYVNGTI